MANSSSSSAPTTTPMDMSRSQSMPQLRASTPSPPPSMSSSSASRLSMGIDRELFHKLEDVNSEIARLSRLSNELPLHRELERVQHDLKRAQRQSSQMIQSQKELLDKIDRQERSTFRRYFGFNREQKVESLRAKLWERMSESVLADAELERLARKSDTLLLESSRRSTITLPGDPVAEVSWQLEELERERQDLVNNLLTTAPAVPVEAQQLQSRLAMYASEMRACESVLKQVDRCGAMYRRALQLLQSSLGVILAPTYSGTLKEFVSGPLVMTIDAGHLIEAAAHGIQPESRRRYRDHAPELQNVRPPKFPQAVVDFSKRARGNYDRKSTLSVEATRKLYAAENVIVLMHRLVIQKLELINKWHTEVEQDLERATASHRRHETRLHQQMAVMARSASA